MTRIRIWNYEEIAKNTRPDYSTVPDSAFRTGESEVEWLFRMILRDLQALAAESRIQVAAHTNFVPVADELALSLDDHVRHAAACVEEGLISKVNLGRILTVDAKLTEMSDRQDPSLWTNEALSTREDWSEARRLAAAALQAMGYDLESPPPRSM